MIVLSLQVPKWSVPHELHALWGSHKCLSQLDNDVKKTLQDRSTVPISNRSRCEEGGSKESRLIAILATILLKAPLIVPHWAAQEAHILLHFRARSTAQIPLALMERCASKESREEAPDAAVHGQQAIMGYRPIPENEVSSRIVLHKQNRVGAALQAQCVLACLLPQKLNSRRGMGLWRFLS
jgi:hypothetical protein